MNETPDEEDYVRDVITVSENRQTAKSAVPRSLQATTDPDPIFRILFGIDVTPIRM